MLVNNAQFVGIMVGVSGAGKTSTIMRMAAAYDVDVMLMSCAHGPAEDAGRNDPAYTGLLKLLSNEQDRAATVRDRADRMHCIICRHFLARVLALLHMASRFPQSSPCDRLVAQVNGVGSSLVSRICDVIEGSQHIVRMNETSLAGLVQAAVTALTDLTGKPLLAAVDEAQQTLRILPCFRSSDFSEFTRPLFSGLRAALQRCFLFSVMSGTGLNREMVQRAASGVAAPQIVHPLVKFSVLSADDCKEYIKQCLGVDHSGVDQVMQVVTSHRLWWLVPGRPRIVCNFAVELCNQLSERDYCSSDAVQQAVNMTYQERLVHSSSGARKAWVQDLHQRFAYELNQVSAGTYHPVCLRVLVCRACRMAHCCAFWLGGLCCRSRHDQGCLEWDMWCQLSSLDC